MLGGLRDLVTRLEEKFEEELCSECKKSRGKQSSTSHGSEEMAESMAPCAQCSFILPDSIIILQQLVAMQKSLETFISHGEVPSHKQSQDEDPCYLTASLIPSSGNPPALYDEPGPLPARTDLRPTTTGLAAPSEVHMSGQKFEEILRDVLAYKVTVDKAVEMARTYTYLPTTKVTRSEGTDANEKSAEKPKRRKISAAKRGLLKLLQGGLPKRQNKRKPSGKSGSSAETMQHQKPPRPRRRKGSHVRQRKKGHVQDSNLYAEPETDDSPAYNTSLSSQNKEPGYNTSQSSREYDEVQKNKTVPTQPQDAEKLQILAPVVQQLKEHQTNKSRKPKGGKEIPVKTIQPRNPVSEFTREVKKSTDSGISMTSDQPLIYDNVSYDEGPNSTQPRTPASEFIRGVKKSSDSGISVESDQAPIYDNVLYTEGPKEENASSSYDGGISMGSESDQGLIYDNVPQAMGSKKGCTHSKTAP